MNGQQTDHPFFLQSMQRERMSGKQTDHPFFLKLMQKERKYGRQTDLPFSAIDAERKDAQCFIEQINTNRTDNIGRLLVIINNFTLSTVKNKQNFSKGLQNNNVEFMFCIIEQNSIDMHLVATPHFL